MIRFIREKFRNTIEKKARKLMRELQDINYQEHKTARRKKRVEAQLKLLGILRYNRHKDEA